MNRPFATILSPVLMGAFVMAGIAIESAVFGREHLLFAQPDLVLIATWWFALHKGFTEGGIMTLLLANAAELHSSVPQGIYLLSYLTIFLMVRFSTRWIVIQGPRSWFIAFALSHLIWKCVGLGALLAMGSGFQFYQHWLGYLIPNAVANGLLGPLAFPWFHRIEQFALRRQEIV